MHKSKGGTYSSIVYEYNKTHPHKLVYVALSSCTNLNNLYLTNSTGDHRFHHKDSNVDKSMVDEFQCLEQHRLPTLTQRYLQAFQEDVDPAREFTLVLLNARFLNAYVEDIKRDTILMKADVLCFTETWNVRKLYINRFFPVVCTEEAERPAIAIAMRGYDTKYNYDPFILAGDINVDITNNDWLVQHMTS